jgi:WS/DGAT/MGAT family acyltransferase
MKPLSGLDGAFLHLETPETPMHVGSLHLFDLPPGYRGDFHADIKKLMARRLHLAPVFQRKLVPMPLGLANPAWVHDPHVDLDWHVQRVTLPAPGGQAELEDMTARLHSEPMDRQRPLWQITVFDGLPAGTAGYYIKVHHAVLDGQAGVLLSQALFDATPKPRALPHSSALPSSVFLPRATKPGNTPTCGAWRRGGSRRGTRIRRPSCSTAHWLHSAWSWSTGTCDPSSVRRARHPSASRCARSRPLFARGNPTACCCACPRAAVRNALPR